MVSCLRLLNNPILILLMSALCGTFSAAFLSRTVLSSFSRECHRQPFSQISEKDSSFDMAELSRRIESLQTVDKVFGKQQNGQEVSKIHLPVVAFDQLLPNQRIQGRTTDETFGRMLGTLGLGGIFAMVGVNHFKRMIRRNGVICRIELVDVPRKVSESGKLLTAVDFQLVALRSCRLFGPATDMKARVGRWRRSYDPDGEQSVCGFGEERFVDVPRGAASWIEEERIQALKEDVPFTEWTDIPVDCACTETQSDDKAAIQKVERIIPLLEQWEKLASNPKTYDNTDVVAASRVMKGQPGLRIDPAALIRRVHKDLGARPPATDPSALALWGAALINPLPPLGVSPEIRGRILEAPDALSKLDILEWGVKRSIANLEGTAPL